MPKKSKKQKQRSAYRTVTRQVTPEQPNPTSQYSKVAPVVASQPRFTRKTVSSIADQEGQYRYIGSEIIRIAIIAGAFFVILIIVSLIIK